MIEQLVLLYFLGIIGMTIMQAPAKSKSHILIIVTSFSWPIAIPIIGLLTDSSRNLSNMVEQSCSAILSSIPQLLNYVFEMVSRGEVRTLKND